MSDKLIAIEQFRAAARAGEKSPGHVYRLATGDPSNVAGKSRTKRFVFSDGSVDRAGDSIDPNGWELGNFRKNPVALFAHSSWDPPIGRATFVGVQGGRLVGDIEFATKETYPFADTIFRLVDEGFIKAVSVGFDPLEWSFVNDKDR